ncbi:MAG: DNA primase [Ruminococcaceae bacterium]|nr:DNA primase [Oscillospiraceae bacterium]
MLRIPDETITEIIERTDIGDYISRYVPLKRAGSVLSGSCPFHSERTPSFTVFPNTKSYYCFGCGAGGNIIGFAMAINGLDYVEALRLLAKETGVPIPESSEEKSFGIKKARIYEANKEAARFFHQSLMGEKGKSALNYLTNRGLTLTTIKRFGIGYAPDSWSALYDLLKSKGFTDEEVDVAFLCKKGKNGKMYDIFRNRIAFPLISTTGEVLGFSARRLNENDDRKYVNTSDTPVFKKSKFVFALNMAKAHSATELIMCEGCVDAIALHQAGFDGAVATLGTAITPEQSRTLAKYTKKIYLCYDSDTAGQTAAEKGIKLLAQLGISSKVVKVTNAKDPDEYIKKYGAESFRKLLQGANGEIDFLISKTVGNLDISISENKLKAVSDVCELLASLDTLAEREIYSERAAKMLGVSKDAITEGIRRRRKNLERKGKKEFDKKEMLRTMGAGDKVNKDKLSMPGEALLEEKLLGILMIQPELYKFAEGRINESIFFTEFGKKVFSVFKNDFESGTEPIISNESLTAEETSSIARMIAVRQSHGDNTKEAVLKLTEALEDKKRKSDADKAISDADEDSRGEALKNYIDSIKKNKK